METTDLARTLIAKFDPNQRPLREFPRSLRWEDGTLASNEDYQSHILDTYAITGDVKKGMEIQMFPNILADISFDSGQGAWVMSGHAVIPLTLDLRNPNAPDDQIISKLSPRLVRYRAIIHRQ
jgi:hypothetical protein